MLLGFYLASSSIAPTISDLTTNVAGMIGGHQVLSAVAHRLMSRVPGPQAFPMTALPARRLLLVHAHPDDESINNGATMAKYAAEGAHVTLVTCTLGEEGEVIPPELAHLAADRDDTLGAHRIGELADGAWRARRHRPPFPRRPRPLPGLRDDGRRRRTTGPDCFWQADLDEAAGHWSRSSARYARRSWSPTTTNGGYGHPDHIQAHRVAMRAAELAADPAYRRDLGGRTPSPRSTGTACRARVVEEGFARLQRAGRHFPVRGHRDRRRRAGRQSDDELVTAAIDGTAYAGRKTAAMRAHATQIALDGPFFALSNDLGQPLFAAESYRLVRGEAGRRR